MQVADRVNEQTQEQEATQYANFISWRRHARNKGYTLKLEDSGMDVNAFAHRQDGEPVGAFQGTRYDARIFVIRGSGWLV